MSRTRLRRIVFVAVASLALGCGEPEPQDIAFEQEELLQTAAELDFDWSVPDRYAASLAAYDPLTVQYDKGYVHPTTWRLNVHPCAVVAGGSNGLTVFVEGVPSAPQRSIPGCKAGAPQTVSFDLPALGKYKVVIAEPITGRRHEKMIELKDMLVVSLGDSYASGEGNSPFRGFGACHNSAKSAHYLMAKEMEEADDKTSVTFLSFACSGAETADVLYKAQHPAMEYCGTAADFAPAQLTRPEVRIKGYSSAGHPLYCFQHPAVPPQLDQLERTVCRGNSVSTCEASAQRPIDRIMMSIGGNDMGFGDIVKECAMNLNWFESPDCLTYERRQETYRATYGLFNAYDAIEDRFSNRFSVGDVFLVGYPINALEQTLHSGIVAEGLVSIDAQEKAYADVILTDLATVGRRAAELNGWNFVAIDFAGHGYGTSDSWINGVVDSVTGQLDPTGTMHPDGEGQAEYFRRLKAEGPYPGTYAYNEVTVDFLSVSATDGSGPWPREVGFAIHGNVAGNATLTGSGITTTTGLPQDVKYRTRQAYVHATASTYMNVTIPCPEPLEPLPPGQPTPWTPVPMIKVDDGPGGNFEPPPPEPVPCTARSLARVGATLWLTSGKTGQTTQSFVDPNTGSRLTVTLRYSVATAYSTERRGRSELWTSTFKNIDGWTAHQHYATLGYPDLDGDGDSDVCGRAKYGVWCGLNDGVKLGNFSTWASEFSDTNQWNTSPSYYETLSFPDLDGNGKADICGRSSVGLRCALSTGTKFGTVSTWGAVFSNANGWSKEMFWRTLKYVDLNNDKRADVCARAIDGIYCGLNDGAKFVGSYWSSDFRDNQGWSLSESHWGTIRFVDVTGDKFPDVCGRATGGVYCGKNQLGLMVPNAKFAPYGTTPWSSHFTNTAGWTTRERYQSIQYGDLNGDGAADVCGQQSNGIVCALSNKLSGFTGTAVRLPQLGTSTELIGDRFITTFMLPLEKGGRAGYCAARHSAEFLLDETTIYCAASTSSGSTIAFGDLIVDATFTPTVLLLGDPVADRRGKLRSLAPVHLDQDTRVDWAFRVANGIAGTRVPFFWATPAGPAPSVVTVP